ncbi:Heterokaryon incompatibility protein [Rutstroemia sp. NJR-2017a BVV2]|nr:Heterokaryon incompatibility protein [Rutstroemia sp. NJR-2017a BVV2]
MSSVYMNSTINIAATAAPDSLAGCFPPRELPPSQSCVVQTAWDNFENSTFGIYSKDIWDILRPYATNLPLLSRGWVLQETLLAPRMLHLAGKQVLWQCRTVDACEEAAFGVPSSPFEYPPAAKWRAFGRSKGVDASTDAEANHEAGRRKISKQEERRYIQFWSRILRDYTGKAFTFHTDKLVALSGVSKFMAGALGSDYFAGIWGRWMISDLCWNVARQFYDIRPEDLPPRPSPYRAPSWSWACLEEPVVSKTTFDTSYDIRKRLPPVFSNIIDSDTESESDTEDDYAASRAVVGIIDCRVDSVTDDKMGALTGGTLRVIGRLATLEILPEWKDDHYSVFCNGSTWSYQLDGTTSSGNSIEITLDCKPPSLKFHCLPMVVPSHSMICLLLLPTGTQKGQFSRYGTVTISRNSLGLGESVYEDFWQIKNEDWLEFESRDEEGWCTLSIV